MRTEISMGKVIKGTILGIILLVVVSFGGKIFEDVGANDIVIIKTIGTGTLSFYSNPGWVWQWGGEVTHLPKSFQYWFSSNPIQGGKENGSILARFNDNGHGKISGSVRIDTPTDEKHLREIYTRYGDLHSIQQELIRTVFEKSVYMAGPLMSSTESAASKRTLLMSYIEDQAQNGIYKTMSREAKTKDAITGAEKTITIVEIISDPKSPNGIARQEESPLKTLGFRASNFSINEIKYDDTVEKQIQSQQKLIMDVQISMAQAKQAEQKALTVAKEGEASAAKAKWEQETIKAKFVTEAEQKKEVAALERDAAKFNKERDILSGQGEAEKKRLIMEADGALSMKLATYEKVMESFAENFAKQKWVPEIQMGSSGAKTGSSALDLIELLNVKTAKDLSLDFSMKGKGNPPVSSDQPKKK